MHRIRHIIIVKAFVIEAIIYRETPMRIHMGVMFIVLVLGLFAVDTVFAASAPDNSDIDGPAPLVLPSFDLGRFDSSGKTPWLLYARYQVNQEAGTSSDGGDQEIVVILGTIILLLAIIILRLRTSVSATPTTPAEYDSHLQTRPGYEDAPTKEAEPESLPLDKELEAEPTLYGRLYVLRGLEEREIPITCEEFTIGRAGDGQCDYQINQPYVSPRHCAVTYRAGEFIIKDLGSKNGTYVNGERLPREREVIVPVGSEIEITKNIALEIWDPDTFVDVNREVVTTKQEISSYDDDELIFLPMPGIAYADDTEGEIEDNYSPI